jgi:hypothetical protein
MVFNGKISKFEINKIILREQYFETSKTNKRWRHSTNNSTFSYAGFRYTTHRATQDRQKALATERVVGTPNNAWLRHINIL